jgi:hypothetical protein
LFYDTGGIKIFLLQLLNNHSGFSWWS